MRILYLSQYFPPEVGATQTRALEMARGLVQAGHQVTMIAEFPNHPHGIIPPEYKGRLYERTQLDGIDVLRVWVYASPVKSFRRRMAFYLSFTFMAMAAGLLLVRGKYDFIYATSPPLFVGLTGLLLSYLRRTPFIFEVRDLWPESAVTLGELRNQRAVQWATWLEEQCYARAKRIVVTSREIFDRLVERGYATQKLVLIRNGANVEMFQPDPIGGMALRAELDLDGKFVLIYAGLHGLAYDLAGLIDVAIEMQQAPDIHFLLVGDGPTKADVEQKIQMHKLTNVTSVPAQSRARIPQFFNAADVSLVPMREPHIVGTLPIKIYDSLACGVPVIASASGEVAHVIQEADAGLVTTPETPAELCTAILTLKNDPARRHQMGEKGRRAVEASYSRRAQAQQLNDMFQALVQRP